MRGKECIETKKIFGRLSPEDFLLPFSVLRGPWRIRTAVRGFADR